MVEIPNPLLYITIPGIRYEKIRIDDIQKKTNYKNQDKLAKRDISKNYINVDWITSTLKKQCNTCYICKNTFNWSTTNNGMNTNMTVDRMDNSQDHNKNNCKLACIQCNVSKK